MRLKSLLSRFTKSVAFIILGLETSASRKSLSPVRKISIVSFMAARKIGRSFASLIFFSSDTSFAGVLTCFITSRALNRKASSAVILSGNFS